MNKAVIFIVVFLVAGINLFAQISISNDNSTPDPSAMLDVKSTTKGTLMPRMTQAQITAISGPANGLQVFCTTDDKIYIFLSSLGQWKEVAYGTSVLTPPFVCGNNITISHHASGGVAPVDKTVTYSTVSGIAGEPAKCWITKNLGATRQATAVNDATEASAGWYWQFNRKQGYQYITSRIPAGTWDYTNDPAPAWEATKDPCTLELGAGWRVPTYNEWHNFVVSGGWTDWNGPYNSALKLHAAGNLARSDGSMMNLGVIGTIWGNVQWDTDPWTAWSMILSSNWCFVSPLDKADALSVRCIRD